jgi:small ligand-binding sensory domain FIST
VGLRPVVSQGCEPIGAPWTITDVDGHVVRTIGNRPAYAVLVQGIKGAELREVPGADHGLIYTHAQQFLDVLEAWLAKPVDDIPT